MTKGRCADYVDVRMCRFQMCRLKTKKRVIACLINKYVIASAAWQSHRTSNELCLCNLHGEIAALRSQ